MFHVKHVIALFLSLDKVCSMTTFIRTLAFLLLTSAALAGCEKQAPAADQAETPTAVSEVAEETQPATEEQQEDAPASQPAAAQASGDALVLGVGATPEDIKPGESNVYGSTFTIIEPPITLANAIDRAGKEGVGPYKVEATIEKVCQAKGCWFTLDADGVEMPIRVKMKDYAFFVPRNAATLPVVLEGTFKQVTIPQDEAQHYADDEAAHTGKPAKKIEGDVDSWMFMASAVQIDHTKG